MSKKEDKKKLKKIESIPSTENEEIMRMVKVLGGIVLVLVAFYFVFAIYNGEIKFSDDEKESVPAEIQNVEILAGSTFLRDNNEYYVLMYDFDGDNAVYGSTIYNMYSQISNGNKMYLVDLGNMLNSSYVPEKIENVNVSSIDTMKVVDISLVKVKAGKAEFVKAGKDAIKEYQGELLK